MKTALDVMAVIVLSAMVLMIIGFECNIYIAKRRFSEGKLKVSHDALVKNLSLMRVAQRGIFVSGVMLIVTAQILKNLAG